MADDPRNPITGPLITGSAEGFLQPNVEVVTGSFGAPSAVKRPWYRAHRLRVFLVVFLALLVPGLAWDFLRPPLYRAAASVITEAVPLHDRAGGVPAPNTQHVAVQGRVLLSQELLEATLDRVSGAAELEIRTADELRPILEVSSLPDTNLVELRATGPEPEWLAVIVNAWIEAYQDRRRQAVEEEVGDARRALQEESESLAATIAAKREALESFRTENEIVTMERDGNEALARLRALNQDLNRARDEAVEAEARFEAIQTAISRGDPVVPASEQGNLDELEARALELRGRLIELEKRYTSFYLENEPDIRIIPAQLEQLDAAIAQKIALGRQVMTVKAEQEVAQARRRVEVMEQDLARQNQVAGRFTAGFAEHETLQNDLTKLEEMHRKALATLVEVDARGLEDYPAVEVVEPAHRPAAPFQPLYWRDALWILLGSSLAALIAVLLLEFLTRRPLGEREAVPVTGVRVYAGGGAALPAGQPGFPSFQPAEHVAAISGAQVASLSGPVPRELIPAEISALWQLADPLSRQLMALLLSGLSLDECSALDAESFDMEGRVLRVATDPPREVPLSHPVADLFVGSLPLPLWAGVDLRQTPEDLSARIGLLAHDAGLAQPGEVTADTLRHSYIAFLVRGGARLTELSLLIGPIPSPTLTRYAALAPAGPAKSLSEVDTLYPTLKVL